MLVNFAAVAMDALVNLTAKGQAFIGGRQQVPMVVRMAWGGYLDGDQHEQIWWWWLGHIPGMKIVVPASPADAGGLMLAAIEDPTVLIYGCRYPPPLEQTIWVSIYSDPVFDDLQGSQGRAPGKRS